MVLPFTNLSGDPSQDYFADGVTENLTTDLSRIAPATPPSLQRQAIDAKAIGKELGVRYVLEGSVQRDQNRVRANAQLIDAESAPHRATVRDGDGGSVQAAGSSGGAIGQRPALRARHGRRGEGVQRAKSGRRRSGDARVALLPLSLPSKDQVDAGRHIPGNLTVGGNLTVLGFGNS